MCGGATVVVDLIEHGRRQLAQQLDHRLVVAPSSSMCGVLTPAVNPLERGRCQLVHRPQHRLIPPLSRDMYDPVQARPILYQQLEYPRMSRPSGRHDETVVFVVVSTVQGQPLRHRRLYRRLRHRWIAALQAGRHPIPQDPHGSRLHLEELIQIVEATTLERRRRVPALRTLRVTLAALAISGARTTTLLHRLILGVLRLHRLVNLLAPPLFELALQLLVLLPIFFGRLAPAQERRHQLVVLGHGRAVDELDALVVKVPRHLEHGLLALGRRLALARRLLRCGAVRGLVPPSPQPGPHGVPLRARGGGDRVRDAAPVLRDGILSGEAASRGSVWRRGHERVRVGLHVAALLALGEVVAGHELPRAVPPDRVSPQPVRGAIRPPVRTAHSHQAIRLPALCVLGRRRGLGFIQQKLELRLGQLVVLALLDRAGRTELGQRLLGRVEPVGWVRRLPFPVAGIHHDLGLGWRQGRDDRLHGDRLLRVAEMEEVGVGTGVRMGVSEARVRGGRARNRRATRSEAERSAADGSESLTARGARRRSQSQSTIPSWSSTPPGSSWPPSHRTVGAPRQGRCARASSSAPRQSLRGRARSAPCPSH